MHDLPTFRYHPDPVATGSVVPSTSTCAVCRRSRGYIATDVIFADDGSEHIACPWCIDDGSAYRMFGKDLTPVSCVRGVDGWNKVPASVAEVVARRTPSFARFNDPLWWTHCGDAAAFIGPHGKTELITVGDDAIRAIRSSETFRDDQDWKAVYDYLDRDKGMCALLFRCLHCGLLGGYVTYP